MANCVMDKTNKVERKEGKGYNLNRKRWQFIQDPKSYLKEDLQDGIKLSSAKPSGTWVLKGQQQVRWLD